MSRYSEAVVVLTEHITRFGKHIPRHLKDEFIDSAAEIVAASCNDAELQAQLAVDMHGLSRQERERA